MRRLHTLSLMVALALLGASVGSYAADNGTLTPAQKQQMQQVVHDYLINNPQILVEVSQKLQQQQTQQIEQIQKDAKKVIPGLSGALFNDPNSPIVGNTKGDVTIVEFFDYQCPHCKDMTAVMDGLMKQDANLRIIYKEFPIFGESSQFASKAALAAEKQGKYAEFHNALMQVSAPLNNTNVMQIAKTVGLNVDQLQQDMNSSAVTQELKENLKLAQQLQLMGTPAFIISNTKNTQQSVLIPGMTSQDVLQGLITQARSNKLPASA